LIPMKKAPKGAFFGLLQSCEFAGALAETGLPQTAIPIALLMFNVGAEIGQLLGLTWSAASICHIQQTNAFSE